jgi:hypothetical protein
LALAQKQTTCRIYTLEEENRLTSKNQKSRNKHQSQSRKLERQNVGLNNQEMHNHRSQIKTATGSDGNR